MMISKNRPEARCLPGGSYLDGATGSIICVMQVAEGDPAERCRSGAIEDSCRGGDLTMMVVPIVTVFVYVNININVYTWQ